MKAGLITTRLGQGGLSALPAPGAEQTPWVENLTLDRDGSWKPRHGLRCIKDFGSRIAMLAPFSNDSLDTNVVPYAVVLTEDNVVREKAFYPGAPGWSTSDFSATEGFPAGLDLDWEPNRRIAVFGAGPRSDEQQYLFWAVCGGRGNPNVFFTSGVARGNDGSEDILFGLPWAHGNHVCLLQRLNVRYSNYGTATLSNFGGDGWPVSNNFPMPTEIGEGVVGIYSQEDLSFIFGTTGIATISGSPLNQQLSMRVLTAPPIAANSPQLACRARDKIYYVSPGPCIYQVAGGIQRIDQPIRRFLQEANRASDLRLFYDPLHDALCCTIDTVGKRKTLLYSLSDERWIGIWTHANQDIAAFHAAMISPHYAEDDDGLNPSNRYPFGKFCLALGPLLSQFDPSIAIDDTSESESAPFVCALESSPEGAEQAPFAEKQLLDTYLDGRGEWKMVLKYRNACGEPYQEIQVGRTQAPGWIYAPQDLPVYRERILRLEALSNPNLRIRSVSVRERLLGDG